MVNIEIWKNKVKRENSVVFISQFYSFLKKFSDKKSKILQETIIDKYKKIYNVTLEEGKFFLDLEKILIKDSPKIDFNVGYFKKFKATNLEVLFTNKYFNYFIKEHHIVALDLSSWEIREIPESIGNLSKLEYLNLANLRLRNLPETLQTIAELKYLNLSGNRLQKLPNWLKNFVGEKYCKNYINQGVNNYEASILGILEILSGKKLEKIEIQDDVAQLEQLFHYKINKDGKIIGLFINHEKIDINIFPQEICLLEFLEELELSNSSIEQIPDCIDNLKILRHLNLSFNRIKSIPDSINRLRNLEYLNIDNNEIPEIISLELRWNKVGENFLEQGEYDKVIDECIATLEVFPKNKLALLHLGIAQKEKGELTLSKRNFKEFLNIDPQSSVVWSLLSDIYYQEGKYEKAIKAIKRALAIEPTVAILWSNLGFNYKKLGKYEDAIASYLHSLKLESNNKNIWRELASIYRDKGEILKAIEADERALEIELGLENENHKN
ncbi:MAG: tetratricopeptide repeat protein [Promethearchaeota archaeon]